ncbi:glycogen debranching enzyme [Paragonimus westermani]|uniref:Glycogen debranching enzyme n=1 Tax=Paragonimus westermani TaxID=34504 RepID=A0A5J4NN21_9TREM|nr:glycogen debranching enzyme [Paragonimus westermani]
MRRVVEFILSDGMNTEGQLFRVKKDVSLIGHQVRFFINYPDPENLKFKRLKYRELSMANPTISKLPVDCFDNFFELSPLPVSGSFHFYFTTDGSAPSSVVKKEKAKISGCGYLTVDPHFGAKSSDVVTTDGAVERSWDLDGVVLQTYLPKNLGHFNEWESRLMTAKEGKYNMIHFTPLQELGYSGSAYSLRDQLKVNPTFTPPGSTKPVDWTDVGKFLQHLENDWSILSMADLVFNHTSNDSPWLHEHPECAYNVVNSPHLVPAYLLDFIVWRLTVETAAGNLADVGIPARLCNPSSEIPAMRSWLNAQIQKAHLDEFFLADIPTIKQEFVSWLLSAKSSIDSTSFVSNTDSLVLKVAGKRKGRRFGGMVDFKLARKLFVGVTDHSMPFTEAVATAAANQLGVKLEELNSSKTQEVAIHLRAAVDNVIANANYRFYDPHGLKLETVTLDTPIMWRYFYQPAPNITTLEEAEAVLNTPDAARVMAFNGWVINDNPLRNFAEPDSYVYLRRELVVWGDSVKLRYGDKWDDCPYLWDRMAEYTELTARLFHAVRLDNCHSTPLHVAQYMLDRARTIRPNLYVVAELFTNSEYQDNIFINKLGLNSLIRESLQPHSAQALGSQLYRYGVTRPAGAFFSHMGHQQLFPSVAHALVYDQTHDNPSVAEKHCVYDFLPLAGLNAILSCAIGSTRGYDELVPHNIDVVHETRPYAKWPDVVNRQTGLIEIKSILNEMHTWLSSQGFTETFVDQFGCSLYKPRMSIKMGHGAKAYTPHVPSSQPSLIEPNSLRMLFSELSLIDINRILFRCEVEELADGLNRGAYNVPGYGRLCYCGFETILRMASWIQSTSSMIKRLAIATVQFYGFIGDCRLPSPAPLLPQEVKLIANQPSGIPLHCSLSAGLPHFAGGMWRSWGRDTFIALRGCLLLTERYEDAANIILSYASLARHGLIPNLTGEGFHVHPRYNCRDAVWYWLYAIVCYEATAVHRQSTHTSQAESDSNNTVEGAVNQVNVRAVSSTNNKVAWIQSSLGSKSLLHRPVWRWFPSDDSIGWPDEKSQPRLSLISERSQALHEVVQEVLQCHATGIDFVERGAGPQLDEHMKPEGFRVTASVDPSTGFPRGGNAYNCGTWMDKMGSSDTARNRGIPATPRDGSAVELVGLAYAVIDWLNKANKNEDNANASYYPYAGVQLPNGKFFTWSDWLSRLRESFEPAFWIPPDTTDPTLTYNRGIYRDSVGSSAGYTDNQLRPNFLVTMVLAPSLFTPERAWAALEIARERLAGPFGMRTLGPNDMAYRGDYYNDVDSTDYATAKGFNYHQGPEWLWPTGYYLRARLLFAGILSANPRYKSLLNNTMSECQNTLARLDKTIRSTPWRSLPELTNSNGQFCRDSCAAQAWSVGCVLEAAYDLLFTQQQL